MTAWWGRAPLFSREWTPTQKQKVKKDEISPVFSRFIQAS